MYTYTAAPAGEIGFRRESSAPYHRELWQFTGSNHFVSTHAMTVATDYTGDYVEATYGDRAGVLAAFRKVIDLPPARSDNAGRIARVRAFAEARFGRDRAIRLLDVGAGLGVFPHAVKSAGWSCTALDPDPRAVDHLRDGVGVQAVCADFMRADDLGRFDIITLNKVLEHVPDPVAMLARARRFLVDDGFVYVEVPDGEAAIREGPGREEFFIEHLHVFSFASTVTMIDRAGYQPELVERLREPSTKYTFRAFMGLNIAKHGGGHGG